MKTVGRRHVVGLGHHARSHYRIAPPRPAAALALPHADAERPWPIYLAGFAAGTAVIATFTAFIVMLANWST